jgi:magnesium chelatase family protein
VPLARVACRAQVGLSAPLVHVEVSLSEGLPALVIVGLPATVVKESKERVRGAILNSGFEFPNGRITVNLAPADVPKEGGRFDLPIALGILLASEQLRLPNGGESPAAAPSVTNCEFYGELALSGELKPTRGLLIAAAHAAQVGHDLVVPRVNTDEACSVTRARVRGAAHLLDVCSHIEGAAELPVAVLGDGIAASIYLDRAALIAKGDAATGAPGGSKPTGPIADANPTPADLSDIRGQQQAKRALLIAAAGGHSLLMIGVPGAGKSTLARRLPDLLPPMTEAEALEVASIASVSAAGFDARTFGRRPFRTPHHTASAAAIIGGGSRARPGEVSLAHHGVLFLDELPEFERRVLEALREPLETGEVSVSRAALQAHYPASFQLVAAMNPCPCGYLGDSSGRCHCSPDVIALYRRRISGPLLDRLDLQIEVQRVPTAELLEIQNLPIPGVAPGTAIAARVGATREVQTRRQGVCNARIGIGDVMRFCAPRRAGQVLLEHASEKLGLSARGYHRILKVARTIADFAGEDRVGDAHVAEAIALRILDRRPLG